MAEGQRRSSRTIKPCISSDFIYDPESVEFLLRRESAKENQHQSNISDNNSPVKASEHSGKRTELSYEWAGLEYPFVYNPVQSNPHILSQFQEKGEYSDSSVTKFLSSDQAQESSASAVSSPGFDFVNKPKHNSSTRLDFLGPLLDRDEVYLSVSSIDNIFNSEMGDDEQLCAGLTCKGCNNHVSSQKKSGGGDSDQWAVVDIISQKMDLLMDKMLSFEDRLSKVEDSGQESGYEKKKSDSRVGESSQESSHEKSSQKKKQGRAKVSKSKSDRVLEARERQLKVLLDKIDKDNNSKRRDSGSSQNGESEVSEGETGVAPMKKKMSKKQRDQCSKRLSARLSEAGTSNPESDYETEATGNSDTVSSGKCKCSHSRKVKSGAKVLKRPVVKTELWPHTIAIEDEGDEVDCDTISLSTFWTCFSYLIMHSKGAEAKGRTALFHAIGMVVKYLSWPDGRTFHNLIMVKIEQNRVSWNDDFAGMALDFVDKKVRMNMRSRNASGGANSNRGYRSNNYGRGANSYGRGANRGFRGSGQGNDSGSGRGRPAIYGAFCWQWNYGTCTYGENCKRWHRCKTCGESGKLGERHKASDMEKHGDSFTPRERS